MNYFLLAETEFFRRINEAGDCNMETAYTAFATQVIELCSGNVDTQNQKKSNEQSKSALCSLLFRNIIYCSHVDCGQRATSASILYAASILNLVVAFVFSHEYLTWNIHFPALSDYIGCPS